MFISEVRKFYKTSLIALVNVHFEAIGGNEAMFQPPWDYVPFKAYRITLIYYEKKIHISEVTNPTRHQIYVTNLKKYTLRSLDAMKQCFSHPGTMCHSKLI